MSDYPPEDDLAWVAARSDWPAPDLQRFAAVRESLRQLAGELTAQVCGRDVSADLLKARYVPRVWDCIAFHWRRGADDAEPEDMEALVERITGGDLGNRRVETNVLREVTLAEAIEQGESMAAEEFEKQYMPGVRRAAQAIGGPRAVDVVDNLAADLILPRGERPPRIATYRGKTTLASWLRAVAANCWVSHLRSQRPAADVQDVQVARDVAVEASLDESDCAVLLRPIFHRVVESTATEDRLLLKMLVLDGVPQHRVATSLRVNSGTITRRHQRAAAKILSGVRQTIATGEQPRKGSDCLELVLTGKDSSLKNQLAELVAEGVRAAEHTEVNR
ncbi:MAG: hypothetical protein RIC55_34905 [Pirellulaceae bacterium]